MSTYVKGNSEKLAIIRKDVMASETALKAIMPNGMDAQRFVRIVVSACSRTPELLNCSSRSIVLACGAAASLGLEPNTPLGHAYLVPFGGECTLIPGYKGLLQLAYQSGMIESIEARAIHKLDTFEIDYGTDAKIVHKPYLDGDPGEMIAVYSVAHFVGSPRPTFVVMSKNEVDRIRARSKTGNKGPWVDDYEQMSLKTVIRRHSKTMPMNEQKSRQFQRGLDLQAAAEDGSVADFSDIMDEMAKRGAPVQGEVVDAETGEVRVAAQTNGNGTRTDKVKDVLKDKAPREPGQEG